MQCSPTIAFLPHQAQDRTPERNQQIISLVPKMPSSSSELCIQNGTQLSLASPTLVSQSNPSQSAIIGLSAGMQAMLGDV
jgi:hypothetical protein